MLECNAYISIYTFTCTFVTWQDAKATYLAKVQTGITTQMVQSIDHT